MRTLEQHAEDFADMALRHAPSRSTTECILTFLEELDTHVDEGNLSVEFVRSVRQRIFSDTRHRLSEACASGPPLGS